jgi:prepilin-type processing-associated H-X9-DG protein
VLNDEVGGNPFKTIDAYAVPAKTVHFVEMAEAGSFAGSDHIHAYLWVGNVASKAASMVQTDQHGGPAISLQSRANYGFLDGHAETCELRTVFTSQTQNLFNPSLQ